MDKTAEGFIFDLDGVIADTAKYHYLAWNRLAGELGFGLRQEDNERLKGVSRMESLEIVLEIGKIESCSQEEKVQLAERKNRYYQEMILQISPKEILPGIKEFLMKLKKCGYRTALGSASRSGGKILKQLRIDQLFDAVIDGNDITKAKPDPEVFQKAAEALGLPCASCIVVEDSQAGIEAAHAGGMRCIGVGNEDILNKADFRVCNTAELPEISQNVFHIF